MTNIGEGCHEPVDVEGVRRAHALAAAEAAQFGLGEVEAIHRNDRRIEFGTEPLSERRLAAPWRTSDAEQVPIGRSGPLDDPCDEVLRRVGEALRVALGDKAGITRFGDALVPLDECLVSAAVDLSGRPYVVHEEPQLVELIGSYDTTLTRHIWESLVATADIALHVRVLSGRDPHHVVEAQFKAVARALRDACALDPRVAGVPSTKGSL